MTRLSVRRGWFPPRVPARTVAVAAVFAVLWAMLSVLLLPPDDAVAAPVPGGHTEVFTNGERESGAAAAYACFRAPAVVKAGDGVTLLAFAEGRVGDCGDSGRIDVVMKRSSDGGSTWTPLQVLARHRTTGGATVFAHNPVPVVSAPAPDAPSGRIALLYTENYERIYLRTSVDNGAQWAAAKEISADVWPVDDEQWGDLYGGQLITGPAHGIRLTHGTSAGRLVVGVTARLAPGVHRESPLGGALIYSDDGGAHWRLGASSHGAEPDIGAQELSLFERGDGSLLVVARNEEGLASTRDRAVYAVSRDGGESFEAQFALLPPLGLPDLGVQASTLAVREKARDGYDRALLAAPVGPNREDLTIRSSFDGGLTWQSTADGALVRDGMSGYSDMVGLGGGEYGVIYEGGDTTQYQFIRFATFTEADLDLPDNAAGLNLSQNTGALATSPPDQLHLFAPTPTGGLGHWFEEADGTVRRGTWGTGAAGETVSFGYGGQQHVLVRGTDGRLLHRYLDPASASVIQQTWAAAGTVAGAPASIVTSNQQHAFVRATDGQLLHHWWDSGTGLMNQQAWAAAGTLAGDPVALAYGTQQHVWATGTDGRLHHWWWTKGPGVRHEIWTGSVRGTPTVSVYRGQQHVYAGDPQGRLTHWWWDPTTQVVKRETLATPVPLAGRPVTFVHNAQQHVFARTTGDKLGHWWWDPATGNNYAEWQGSLHSDPVAHMVDGTQHVYGAAADETLTHWWWNAADGVRQESWGGRIAKTAHW
ncbi:exo-alpha-sialidase [Streptomyces sp. NPDC050804]|uniref:exo-alpha-sialidase n=1 Tax=Streptomyces sp. NPDC050804 TaxID=3154745 RepID=UPI00343BF9D5